MKIYRQNVSSSQKAKVVLLAGVFMMRLLWNIEGTLLLACTLLDRRNIIPGSCLKMLIFSMVEIYRAAYVEK